MIGRHSTVGIRTYLSNEKTALASQQMSKSPNAILQTITWLSLCRCQLKKHDTVTKVSLVDKIRNQIRSFVRNQVLRPNCTQRPQIDITRVLDIYHVFLTSPLTETGGGAPIFKETVQPSAVHEDVGAVDNSKTPGLVAVGLSAVGVSGIVPLCASCIGSEWDKCVRVCLKVGCFLLDRAHEHVGCARELVIIESRMLHGGSI